jgi:hypothetical protein
MLNSKLEGNGPSAILMNRDAISRSEAAVGWLAPVDRLRCQVLKALGPMARVLVRRRELRVAVAGCGVLMVSLVGVLGAPFWLLALGPVVLGVPHLVADLRYLVVRPGLHRRRGLWLPVGGPLLLAAVGWHSMAAGLVACAAMALLARGPMARKGVAVLATGAVAAGVVVTGPAASLIFAHLHNVIAVVLWWLWRPRTTLWPWLMPSIFSVLSLLLLVGALEPWARGLAWQPAGLGPDHQLSFLAPGVPDPWALRLVLLFAFAQSVHYGVWLRLIPEDDRTRPTPRTFQATARALRSEFGWPALTVAVVLAAGIALWATFDLVAARENYLRMALFHGYLELVALVWLFIERPQRAAGP